MSILYEAGINNKRSEFQKIGKSFREMIYMESHIEKNKFRYFNLVNILNKAVSKALKEYACWIDSTGIRKIPKSNMIVKIPENPAVYCQLGWRKDS